MKDLILGIETSCDDTCACLMSWRDGHIEYSRSIHQDEVHAKYGGIVPNLAAGEHLEHIKIIKEELQKCDLMRIACVAATTGPGLIGSLLVGVSFAKGIAMSLGIPLLRINHLEGHALSCMIENDVKFPFLLLLVSGGNSLIVLARELGNYRIIGQTLDDAAGEALDKIAKNLEIEYPGGINLEKWALKWERKMKSVITNEIKNESKINTNNNEWLYNEKFDEINKKNKFHFTNGCINKHTFNFSFSGLKTQILYKVRDIGGASNINDDIRAELAFMTQETVFETLTNKIKQVINNDKEVKELIKNGKLNDLVLCGGVSANKRLAKMMQKLSIANNLRLIVPSLKYTTDNADMIAKVGCIRWNEWKNNKRDLGYSNIDLSFSPFDKWDLENVENIWKEQKNVRLI